MESLDSSAESSANPSRDTKDSNAEGSDDELIFTYPSRGAFKRKVQHSDGSDEDDSDGAGKGGRNGSDSDDDDDDDDDDSAFNSSPESRRVRTAPFARVNRLATAGDAEYLGILSSDDEGPTPTPKRRHVPDRAAIEAKAQANVNEFMDKLSDGSVDPPSVSRPADWEYQREYRRQMAAASVVEDPGRTGSGLAERQAAMSAAAEASAAASRQAAAERSRCELSRKNIKLRVERSKNQVHIFRTALATEVGKIATGCRQQRALLSRDEEDAELSLYYQETLLDGDKSLMDCGITEDATLRLEVTGEAACFSGPPIFLKVRTHGGKTFTVETTMDTTFSAFMEGFNAAVGVPPERAGESVFTFDGDNLRPTSTPKVEDMDSGELIDAKLPADLMNNVQASLSAIKLTTRPKKKQAGGKKVAGATSSARSTTPAATAAAAVPLGMTRSTRSKRATRSNSSSSSSSSSAVGAQEPEIVVLD